MAIGIALRPRRDEALELHRAGQITAARRAYEVLLEADPGDPDLLGLLGVVALQEARPGEAERLLRRSLVPGAEAGVFLRNLNNLVVLLRESGREAEAKELVAGPVPDWPAGRLADTAERGTVLSLAEAMIGHGEMEKARALIDRALPDRSFDAAALNLDGRLRLAAGDAEGAVRILERAVRLAPEEWPPLVALGAAQEQAGQRDAARATTRRIVRKWPIYATPPRPSHKAALMVLNPVPAAVDGQGSGLRRLHFSSNYASEIASRLEQEYRFLSLIADLGPEAEPQRLPPADLVLNNVVNSEKVNVPGQLETLRAVADRFGRPVINAPDQVFQTTRQKNALLLEGVPDLRVPRVERYGHEPGAAGEIAADMARKFDYPVILRKTMAHQSAESVLEGHDKTAVLVTGPDELQHHLEQSGWREFYAIEFVDLKRPDGLYRKLRAVVMDDEVIVCQGAMNQQWMVSGWRDKPEGIAFYRAHPQVIAECNRIVRDPEAELGPAAMRALAAIGERIPLDLFGIDFEVDREGRVVLFEASAAMIFHGNQNRAPEDVRLPPEVSVRIDKTFHRMVGRRLGV